MLISDTYKSIEIYQVKCPKCGKIRIISGKRLLSYCRKNNIKETEQFDLNNPICQPCSNTKKLYNRNKQYRVICPICKKSKTTKGSNIQDWCRRHHIEESDFVKKYSCSTCFNQKHLYKYKSQYNITCFKCNQIVVLKGNGILTYCKIHNIKEEEFNSKYICANCKTKFNIYKISEHYQVSCSKCGKIRTLLGHSIQQFCYKNHITETDYVKYNLCGHCASQSNYYIPSEHYKVKCNQCNKEKTIKGYSIYVWCKKHNVTQNDYALIYLCYSCLTLKNYIYQKEQLYKFACSKCKKSISIKGQSIHNWCHTHKVSQNNYHNQCVCLSCAKNKSTLYLRLENYTTKCSKCGKVVDLKGSNILSWCRNHHIKDTDFTNNYLCLSCVCTTTTITNKYQEVKVNSLDPYFCMANTKYKNKGYVLKHRYIMAQILGRPLERWEQVHHRDGNKTNNSPSNLELRSLHHHGNGASITPNAEELLKRVISLWEENKLLKESQLTIHH